MTLSDRASMDVVDAATALSDRVRALAERLEAAEVRAHEMGVQNEALRERLDSHHNQASDAVFDRLLSVHYDLGHVGLLVGCRRPECDGWDLVFRSLEWSFNPG